MQKIIQKYLGKRYAESQELGHQCVAWAKLFASEMGRPLKGFSGSALKGWQTGSPFSAEWKRVENTPQAVPSPGDIIFFDATKANPYGHVAVVERADQKMIIVIEQNAGNGNGNGLGMNAITRNTVGYTASGSRGKCLGWYSYVGKPTATTATTATNTTTKTATTEKPLTLKEIYEREKPEGYVPLFANHDDPTPVTRGEVAIYGELARIRSEKK